MTLFIIIIVGHTLVEIHHGVHHSQFLVGENNATPLLSHVRRNHDGEAKREFFAKTNPEGKPGRSLADLRDTGVPSNVDRHVAVSGKDYDRSSPEKSWSHASVRYRAARYRHLDYSARDECTTLN